MPIIHRAAATAALTAGAVTAATLAAAPGAMAQSLAHHATHGGGRAFIHRFHKISTVASTVPANGDVNPYGVAVVQRSLGRLVRGDVLVSNFNNKKNQQGTGRTIVEISPAGMVSQFAKISPSRLPGACPGGIGLTTALAVLPGGWVVVGSLPTTNGTAATASAGCLLVLNSQGKVAETISGRGINGPWDMAAVSFGHRTDLFVSNVLNGTVAAKGRVVHRGTVLRLTVRVGPGLMPQVLSRTVVGSGFAERTDPAALVIGPTGLGVGRHGALFVADSLRSRVMVIGHAITRTFSAGVGQVVTSGGALNTPLGLALAPNGDVLTVNGGNGNLVETTPSGRQIATRLLDNSGSPPGAGALFGLAVAPHAMGVYYVDDAVNTLRLLH